MAGRSGLLDHTFKSHLFITHKALCLDFASVKFIS
jgi:hypothetical protein